MDDLFTLIYWGIIGYSSFCALLLAMSALDKMLCRVEEKRFEREWKEEKTKRKEFEKKHQTSPNASIVDQGMFVARTKEELDKMFDSIGTNPSKDKRLSHKNVSNAIYGEVEIS